MPTNPSLVRDSKQLFLACSLLGLLSCGAEPDLPLASTGGSAGAANVAGAGVGGAGGSAAGSQGSLAGGSNAAGGAGSGGGGAGAAGGGAALAGPGRAPIDQLEPGDPCLDVQIPEAQGALEGIQFNIWIPGGIPTLRCVTNAGDEAHRELARLNHCAVMRIPSKPAPSGQQIAAALANFARLVPEHPELEHLQVLGIGYSFTYGERSDQAEEAPERFMAVFGGGIHSAYPDTPALAPIFWLSQNGDRDNGSIDEAYISMGSNSPWWAHNIALGRAVGARYAQTLRWGGGHEWSDSRHLLMPFLHQTIAHRAPKPGVKLTQLTPIAVPESQGWLVSAEDWNTPYPTIAAYEDWQGERSKASWVSDEYMAHIVRAYTAKAPPIRITTPACDDDNCRVGQQDVGTSVTVVASVASDPPPTSVRLWDGNELLAELTAAPYEFTLAGLPLGPHTFIAEAIYASGSPAVSRPRSLLLSRPKPMCP